MSMNFEEAMQYIAETGRRQSKLGLRNIRLLMDALGNPERSMRFVHIAGTNGKGSAAAMLSSVLQTAGYMTGRFTSPDLLTFTERVVVNGEEIPRDDLCRILSDVRDAVRILEQEHDAYPTVFEISTALALLYFKERGCDVAVMEVGLGGRLDSTNVIPDPAVSVIMPISFDHMAYLGDSLEEIAFEKAGIIRDGGTVISAPQEEIAADVLRRVCAERAADLRFVDEQDIVDHGFGAPFRTMDYRDLKNVRVHLSGNYQLINAATVLEAIRALRTSGFDLPEEAVRTGLANVTWPGRFELIQTDPTVVIDGAHNPHGIRSLERSLREVFPDARRHFIIGFLADKDYRLMLETILPLASSVTCVAPPSDRALPAEELSELVRAIRPDLPVSAAASVEEACETADRQAAPEDVICAFGSLYYIGLVKLWFRGETPPETLWS